MPTVRRPPLPSPGARRAHTWAQAAPALVAALLYAAALGNGFAYDDVFIVERNARLHSLTALPEALGTPYWPEYGRLYRPLTTLSFALEWAAGGGAPWLFHFVNLVWHAAVSALVARLALRWMPAVGALGAGLLFAVHPVHVEAVANVVGRSELACAAALLGIALLATREAPSTPGRRLAVVALAAAALGSKETGVVAPLVAWAAHAAARRAPATGAHGRHDQRDGLRLAGAAALGVLPLLAARLAILGTLGGDLAHPAFLAGTPGQDLALALATLPRAAGLLLAPQLPRPDYSPTLDELQHPNPALVVLGAALALGALAVLVRHARAPSPVTFALVFGVVTFAPVSNVALRTGIVLAERTLYSPSVGVALLLGAGLAAAWAARRRTIVVLAACLLATSAAVAAGSVSMWRSTEAVVAAMRRRDPSGYRGHYQHALLRAERGDTVGAETAYGRAIALFGRDAELLYAAGSLAHRRHDPARAADFLSRAVAADPAHRRARTLLVRMELGRGNADRARALLAEGLRREPDQRLWRQLLDSLRSRE
jgi:hypothetical protein